MTGSKRERDVARAKYERQQAKKAAEDAARRRRNTIVATVVGLALVAAGSVWLVRSNASNSTPSAASTPTLTPTPSATSKSSQATAPVTPNPSGTIKGVTCTAATPTRADNLQFASNGAPNLTNPAARNYIKLTTNCGEIEITMNPAKAPETSKVMSWLTNEKYFDATACHRLTTSEFYIVQCGDPRGDGTGRPGFKFDDENLPAAGANNYPAGTVAMANSGPNTNGSQFFMVYKDSTLPNAYTQWGTITKGLDVVQYVAEQGTVTGKKDGLPKQPLVISKAQTFAETTVSPPG